MFGVAFHFKQWGAWFPVAPEDGPDTDDSRLRRFGGWLFKAMAKEEAGRDLDGRVHDARPSPAVVH